MKDKEIGICEICKEEKELDIYMGKQICLKCYLDLKVIEKEENREWDENEEML